MKKYFIITGVLLLVAVLVLAAMLYSIFGSTIFMRIEIINMPLAVCMLIAYLVAIIMIGIAVVVVGYDYYQEVMEELYINHKKRSL